MLKRILKALYLLFICLFIVDSVNAKVLYDKTVEDDFPSDWTVNTSRKWILTGTMDGEITKKYAGYSNLYQSNVTDGVAGLPDGDDLTIIVSDLNIDISGYQDVRLNIDYLSQPYASNLITSYGLEVYVKNESSDTYGPFYLEYYETKGFYERIQGTNKIYERNLELVTQRISMSSGNKITEIVIKPYGNYPGTCDENVTFAGDWRCSNSRIIGIANIKLVGYENSTFEKPNYVVSEVKNVSDVRAKTINRIYDEATIEWSPSVTFSDIFAVTPGRRYEPYYEKGKVYYGIPYTQKNRITVEKFSDDIDSSGKLSLPDDLAETNFDGLDIDQTMTLLDQNIGQDCSSSVSYAVSKFVPLYSMYDPSQWIWDRNKTTLLGNIKISGKERASELSSLKKSDGVTAAIDQDLYKGYAELIPGDIVSTHSKVGGTHVMLISGNTHVFCTDGTILSVANNKIDAPSGNCDSHGGINPDASYTIITDIRPYALDGSDPNTYGGSLSSSDYTISFVPNKNYTSINNFNELQGKNLNFRINSKFSFTELKNKAYLPLEINSYIDGKIEKPYARLINENTVNNIKDGFKGTLYSNYTIISVTYKIFDYTNDENFEYIHYPTHTSFSVESQVSSVYSLYYNTPAKLQSMLKLMLSDSTDYEVNVSVNVGESIINVLSLKTDNGNSVEEDTDSDIDGHIINPETGEGLITVIGLVMLLSLVSIKYIVGYRKK